MSVAFRLEGELLHLVVSDLDGSAAGERAITIELDERGWVLELTLALKTLRAEADSGAGISAWGGRPADQLKRPPPAE